VARSEVLLFDVNETLLDLAALKPHFAALFGSSDPMGEWFARLLHGSLVANHTNRFRSFGTIAGEALMTLARRRGMTVSREQAAGVTQAMRDLPPYPEVSAALGRMLEAGYRLVTLTNGSTAAVTSQLRNAGIEEFFERAISVDAVGRFKPAPEVYLYAAVTCGVEVDRAMMVAAHDWDVIGARSVGMPGAFIARPTAVWGLPDPLPQLAPTDLAMLADQIIEQQDLP
jgi:2-haloacid dehalogenase